MSEKGSLVKVVKTALPQALMMEWDDLEQHNVLFVFVVVVVVVVVLVVRVGRPEKALCSWLGVKQH